MCKNTQKKVAKVLLFVILFSFIFSIFTCSALADDKSGGEQIKSVDEQEKIREDFQTLLDNEKGTLFEKAIANFIASIAYFFTSIGSFVFGFKDLDALLFNKDVDSNLPPFTDDYWAKMNDWYKAMSYISAGLLFYATAIIAFKFIKAGTNPKEREEAIESMKRLAFSWIIVLGAPIFVRVLLQTNNWLVDALKSMIGSRSVAEQLGTQEGGILYKVRTGNVISTALIIVLFSFINFKINIMFLIRMFVMTTLYIFTPFVTVMWVINKNVNAAGIWLGEMLSNAFMQFSYAFVFSIYLSFAGDQINWATSIIWAYMIITVADVIRNSVQSLYARLSGINENGYATGFMGLIGLSGIPSIINTIGGQFPSINGPGGSSLGRAMNTAFRAGSFGNYGIAQDMGQGTAQGATRDIVQDANQDTIQSPTQGVQVDQGEPQGAVQGTAQEGAQVAAHEIGPGVVISNASALRGPSGGSVEKAAYIARALDYSAGTGYYVERGINSFSTMGSAAFGQSGAGIVQGVGKMAGAGIRTLGGAIGIGMATKNYMRESGKGFVESVKDLTGSDSLPKASLRMANLYASHVFSSPQRVRDKLVSYHTPTSIDGMRYK